jgi:hypothetical protein
MVREQGGLSDILDLLQQTDNHHMQLEAAGTLSVLSHDRMPPPNLRCTYNGGVRLCMLFLPEHTAEACAWMKERAVTLRQILESPGTTQPQLLASLLHIIKRLCQTDGDYYLAPSLEGEAFSGMSC